MDPLAFFSWECGRTRLCVAKTGPLQCSIFLLCSETEVRLKSLSLEFKMDKKIFPCSYLDILETGGLCTNYRDGGLLLFRRQGWYPYLLGQGLWRNLEVSWSDRKSTSLVGRWGPGFQCRPRYCLCDLLAWVSGPQFPRLLNEGVGEMDLRGFLRLWYSLGLRVAFSVCHSLPCQLCLSQRLIHFNCTLECSRERGWMDCFAPIIASELLPF